MSAIKITESLGRELHEESYASTPEPIEFEGHTYTYVDTKKDVEDHRWNTTHLYVYEREDGKLFGMLFDIGLTETQESGFVYNNPELYEVERKEQVVTTVYYEAVK